MTLDMFVTKYDIRVQKPTEVTGADDRVPLVERGIRHISTVRALHRVRQGHECGRWRIVTEQQLDRSSFLRKAGAGWKLSGAPGFDPFVPIISALAAGGALPFGITHLSTEGATINRGA